MFCKYRIYLLNPKVMSELGIKVKERLLLFVKHNGMSNLAFEKACGLSNGYLRNFKGNLGGDKLANILSAFPELNKEWLLYGEGSMFQEEKSNQDAPIPEQTASGNPLIDYLQRKIAELESKVDKLNDEKAELLQENAILKYENMMLSPKGDAEDAVSSSSASAV